MAWLRNSDEFTIDRVILHLLRGTGSCILEESRKPRKYIDRCLPALGKWHALCEGMVTAHLVKLFVFVVPAVYRPLERHLRLGL